MVEDLSSPVEELLQSPPEEEECDTKEAEELKSSEIMQLMIPSSSDSKLPMLYDRFAMTYSIPAFKGWVKQPSPSCAAASFAGAWNTLHGYDRNHSDAIDVYAILSFYKEMIRQKLERKHESLQRLLSIDSIEPLTTALRAKGIEFGQKKSVQRKLLVSSIEQIVFDSDAFLQLRESLTPPETEGEIIEDQLDWKSLLYDYYHMMDGLAKLNRPKPSTSLLGNWAVLQAAREFSPDDGLKGSYLFGKKGTICISNRDDPDKVKAQWSQLWSAFVDPKSVLIFHLTNHYALIFAMREYVDPETDQVIREILTARKGQRPSSWIRLEQLCLSKTAFQTPNPKCIERISNFKMEVYLAAAPLGFRQACREIEELRRSKPQEFKELMVSCNAMDFIKRGLLKYQITSENEIVSCLEPYLSRETAVCLFSNYQPTRQKVEIDQLKEIKWKMGQTIASDSCQALKIPFVQLQLTLKSNETFTIETNLQEFNDFQELLHENTSP